MAYNTEDNLDEMSTNLGQNRLNAGYRQAHHDRFAQTFNRAEQQMEGLKDTNLSQSEQQQKVNEIFNGMTQQINNQKQTVIKEMSSMTPAQQNEVVGFWRGMGAFLSDLLSWIKNAFFGLLRVIKEGILRVARRIKDIFVKTKNWLKSIFE